MVLLRGFNILKTVAALFSLLGGLMMFVPLVDFLSGASISRVFLAFSIVLLAGGTLLVYKVKSEEGLSFIEATISST
ncbi:MAG: TrkH family potassium uptake protein, partial [Thermosphaera sp.]